jgi:hypothetical protein
MLGFFLEEDIISSLAETPPFCKELERISLTT